MARSRGFATSARPDKKVKAGLLALTTNKDANNETPNDEKPLSRYRSAEADNLPTTCPQFGLTQLDETVQTQVGRRARDNTESQTELAMQESSNIALPSFHNEVLSNQRNLHTASTLRTLGRPDHSGIPKAFHASPLQSTDIAPEPPPHRQAQRPLRSTEASDHDGPAEEQLAEQNLDQMEKKAKRRTTKNSHRNTSVKSDVWKGYNASTRQPAAKFSHLHPDKSALSMPGRVLIDTEPTEVQSHHDVIAAKPSDLAPQVELLAQQPRTPLALLLTTHALDQRPDIPMPPRGNQQISVPSKGRRHPGKRGQSSQGASSLTTNPAAIGSKKKPSNIDSVPSNKTQAPLQERSVNIPSTSAPKIAKAADTLKPKGKEGEEASNEAKPVDHHQRSTSLEIFTQSKRPEKPKQSKEPNQKQKQKARRRTEFELLLAFPKQFPEPDDENAASLGQDKEAAEATAKRKPRKSHFGGQYTK